MDCECGGDDQEQKAGSSNEVVLEVQKIKEMHKCPESSSVPFTKKIRHLYDTVTGKHNEMPTHAAEVDEAIDNMMLKRLPQLTVKLFPTNVLIRFSNIVFMATERPPLHRNTQHDYSEFSRRCDNVLLKLCKLPGIETLVLTNILSTVAKLKEDITKANQSHIIHKEIYRATKIDIFHKAIDDAHQKANNCVTEVVKEYCRRTTNDGREVSVILLERYTQLKEGITDAINTLLLELNAVSINKYKVS